MLLNNCLHSLFRTKFYRRAFINIFNCDSYFLLFYKNLNFNMNEKPTLIRIKYSKEIWIWNEMLNDFFAE